MSEQLTRKQIEQELRRRGWRQSEIVPSYFGNPRQAWCKAGRWLLFVNACIEEKIDPTWALETGK